jgi:hypothetical protein
MLDWNTQVSGILTALPTYRHLQHVVRRHHHHPKRRMVEDWNTGEQAIDSASASYRSSTNAKATRSSSAIKNLCGVDSRHVDSRSGSELEQRSRKSPLDVDVCVW